MARNSPIFINIGPGLYMLIGLPTITVWKTANRPKKAKKGTFGFNFQTNSLEYWDGNFWFAAVMSPI